MKKRLLPLVLSICMLFVCACGGGNVTNGSGSDTEKKGFHVVVENGVIFGTTDNYAQIEKNRPVVVEPISQVGQVFTHWEIDGEKVSEDAKYTFVPTKSVTITAVFAAAEQAYVLTEKKIKGVDITKTYVFNAIIISNGNVSWYETDAYGETVKEGTALVTDTGLEITIGLRKYAFLRDEELGTLSFSGKIDRKDVVMNYVLTDKLQIATPSGGVDFSQELFGDDINENFYNYCPSAMIENGNVMHVWYCSNKDSGKVTDYVAYRKGVLNADGKWTFGEKQLVLSPTANTWDKVHVCDPSVVKGDFGYKGEKYSYLMAYLGCAYGDVKANEVGLAVAKNPEGPYVKIDEINPIANYHEEAAKHEGDGKNWMGAWGFGQPSVVSVDKGSKVLLTYTAGTPNGTGAVAEIWDFADLTNPVKLMGGDISKVGVVNAYGATDSINNADFAFDPDENRIYCIKEDFPYPTDGETNWITGSNTVLYMDLDDGEINMEGLIKNTAKSWTVLDRIVPDKTGFARNHNCGFVTDEYGWILNPTVLGVLFTSSALKRDYPEWEAGGQWPALHTYRIHGTIVDLP